MSTWTFSCWNCQNETEMDDKVTRSDICPHCSMDMRSYCESKKHMHASFFAFLFLFFCFLRPLIRSKFRLARSMASAATDET